MPWKYVSWPAIPWTDVSAEGNTARPSGGPEELVEHFFRHESARLVAVLTRAFGVQYLGLVEDNVQDALLAAVQTWSRRGVPANPGGWIYRVARNRVLDALRRQATHQRVLGELPRQGWAAEDQAVDGLMDDWLSEERLPDSLLRMMFVCAHPALDRRSQLALTLKVLCGFNLAEVAKGLLMRPEAAKKRVQRARKTLAKHQVAVELPSPDVLPERLAAVHDVLYLMFNEGYSTSHGHEPLRDDVCEEAARLCHLLCEHESLSTADSMALLSLMLAHASRLKARLDGDGVVVLLADQDRSRWDRRLIGHAEMWLGRSKTDSPSRFHYEAAISLAHCRAPSIETTDWATIVQLYDRLLVLQPSPLYVLNRAIAKGEAGDIDAAFDEVESVRAAPELDGYILVDCAVGRLYELALNPAAAASAYAAARARAEAPHERALLDRKLLRLETGSAN